jgi:hypothetical protein
MYMQHSAHSGSGRRQDRVPLAVGIDLRGIDLQRHGQRPGVGGESEAHESDADEHEGANVTLAADGLNVSIGGIAMRSSYIPPLGALLECTFQCPPTGDTVCAQGEVIWAERSGPDEGEFGMRFVELDTKSATALRRYVVPSRDEQAKPERLRAATLVIDGLGNTVEAELKLADESRIVLEQQLSFLQLGRGVEVSVPGRGKERGRIASVELRHTHFDVPTLVFGVLLDDAPERQAELVPTHVAPLFSTPFSTVMRPELPVSAQASARMRESGARARERYTSIPDERTPALPGDVLNDMLSRVPRESRIPEDPPFVELLGFVPPATQAAPEHELATSAHQPEDEPQLLVSAADSAPALCVEDAEIHADAADGQALEDEESEEGSENDEQDDEQDDEQTTDEDEAPARGGHLDSPMALRVRSLPLHLRALFRAQGARLSGLRQRIEPTLREQAEYFDLPDAKTRLLVQIARLRALLLQSWSKVRRSTARTGPRAPRTLRVQRSTLLGLGPADNERAEPSKLTRGVAIAFAVLGVGLGVYALAPRSGADRIKLPERIEAEADALGNEPVLAASKDELEFVDDDVELAAELKRGPEKRAARPTDKLAAVEPRHEAAAEATEVSSAPFGEAEVPNGRVFTLRMNGPVQLVEGEARDHGFTVRVPGRLAVDKASPIATSHDAVQRAMILNRGGYAELTVDFASGKSPRYQVRGKDNTLEVTLERL